MKFYIVTPCFRDLPWLQCCVRSVADQAGSGVEVHHHVQDAASDDGTAAWLQEWREKHANTPFYTFTFSSAPDNGMYDALNKAWMLLPADADVTAQLNADEQYLSGALQDIATQFSAHPEAEILEASYIVIDADGDYVCHRRPVPPHRWTSMRNCELITCACFHKASAFRRHGIRFDTRFRVYGDVIFFRDLLCARVKVVTLPGLLTTVFAMTGHNMAWVHIDSEEARMLDAMTPRSSLLLEPLSRRFSNGVRLLVDLFTPPPPSAYQIYPRCETKRCEHIIKKATCRWPLPSMN